MKARGLIVFLLLFVSSLSAQHQLGLRTENAAGINGVALNPAAPLLTPFPWQINLLEGSFFFENNYAYFEGIRLGDLLQETEDLEVVYAPYQEEPDGSGERTFVFDIYTHNNDRFAALATSAMGPSFFVRIGGAFSLGVVARARTGFRVAGVAPALSYDQLERLENFDRLSVAPLRFAALGWTEAGLNLGYRCSLNNGGALHIGITAKALQGYESVYIENESPLDLTVFPGDSLLAASFDVRAGYTTTLEAAAEYSPQNNGSGVGFDLGVIYTDAPEGESPYRWRLGVSLLDLGSLRFDRNAQAYRFRSELQASLTRAPYDEIQGVENVDSLLQILSDQALGDPQVARAGTSFDLWLPAALSVQVDRALGSSFFMNATLVHGLPLGENRLSRGALLAVTPRWETKWLGASLPISLYEWNRLRVGAGLRLGFVYLGTDKLGSLLLRQRFSGADFYFALRFQPWWEKRSGGGKKRSGRRGRRGNVKCYEF